jgi:hypothetical protein
MGAWRGPLDGWQELLGVWGLFVAFAILVLGAVAANALARPHPSWSRWEAAVGFAAHQWARRLGALTARATEAPLQQIAELAHRWERAVRRLDELGVQRRASGAAVNETIEA